MIDSYSSRTDLAVEINESIPEKEGKVNGIIFNEYVYDETQIKVSELEITNEKGAKLFGKPMGKYVTIEATELSVSDEFYEQEAARLTSEIVSKLIYDNVNKKSHITILVAGLGNKEVTADALGPMVIENISVDRHMGNTKSGIWLSGITPGVMAQTGMETASILKGVVNELKPDLVIAIDALAARSSSRLNTTIQISDRGINPGSGVGNHRLGITKETLGVPVIAIGVPTVIAVPTIVADTMENLLKSIAAFKSFKGVDDVYEEFTKQQKMDLIREILSPEMAEMVVTPKDIDASVRTISYIVADAINIACKK
ncbi:MAG: GPR endopeptidase [Lachnospiraceae bacterium]